MEVALKKRQTVRAIISPGIRLGLEMLALPVNELKDAVKRELETNPAIEIARPFGVVSRTMPLDSLSAVENLVAPKESLEAHLINEITLSEIDDRQARIAKAIVSELDADGRFTGSIADMMMVTGFTAQELESARQLVMKLSPLGCGAVDLKECFLAQIEKVPSTMRNRFRKELKHLESGKVDPEIVKLLKTLDPFPGRRFGHTHVDYIAADVIVNEQGEVYVNDGDIPELKVSPKYIELAKDEGVDEETRKYAFERVKRAREFRAAIIRRRETLEVAIETIFDFQHEFLKKGVEGLRKLNLSEVAKRAKCSVATISRAAMRKYVKTPSGILPLRSFFPSIDPKVIAKLKDCLKALPQGEHLSDQEISERLKKAGFMVARRTVNKYRKLIGFSTNKV